MERPVLTTLPVTFGSDNQAVKVAIDTGSDELFVDPNCNDSEFSSFEQKQCEANGRYDPSTSSSSSKTGETSQIVYGSGAVNIEYYTDAIGIPGASQNLTKVQFGRATASEDLNEGILGTGFGKGVNLNYSNFIDALEEQGVTNTKAFSVGLGTSSTAGGSVVFGGIDTKKFSGSLASLDILSPTRGDIQRYAVALSAISYSDGSGTATKLSGSSLNNVLLDTGSSLCELPTEVVESMASTLDAQEDQSSGLLLVDCDFMTASHTLEFAFDGVTIVVPMTSFILQDGPYCILGVQALQSGSGITALLGDTFLRSAYVVFDQTNMKIGMAQYENCGTNEQPIPTGSAGATGFTGECTSTTNATTSSTSSSSQGSSAPGGVVKRPAAGAVFALVAGIAALMTLF